MIQQQFQISPQPKAPNSAAPFFVAWLLSFVLLSIPFAPISKNAASSVSPLSPAVAFYDVGVSVATRFFSSAEKQRSQSDKHGFLPPNRLRERLSKVLGYFTDLSYSQPAYPQTVWKGISKRGPPFFL
jgi:hypothetical protein